MGPDESLASEIRILTENGLIEEFKTLAPVKLVPDKEEHTKYLKKLLNPMEFSGTISIDISNKYHMSRKRFKKILMSKGLGRNSAELICDAIRFTKGQISYRSVFINTLLFSGDHVLFFDVWSDIFYRTVYNKNKGVTN